MSWELYQPTPAQQKENRRRTLVILCFAVLVVVAVFGLMA
mgnify:FL=1